MDEGVNDGVSKGVDTGVDEGEGVGVGSVALMTWTVMVCAAGRGEAVSAASANGATAAESSRMALLKSILT